MNRMNEPARSLPHKNRKRFTNALAFSARTTGFLPRLIEKDYFCTLVLDHLLSGSENKLVFKGGTCLSKVHASFYRLSEDLDFVIPMAVKASPQMRSNAFTPVRAAIESLPDRYPAFRIEELRGANRSRQYLAYLSYTSMYGQGEGKLKVEVGLREPLLDEPIRGAARTILIDPATMTAFFQPTGLPCMSLREAVAEKFRAALTRREVAIRDFYDIGFVVRSLGFDHLDEEFLAMVKDKLAVPGNEPVDVSDTRFADLKPQIAAQLKPVLRARDFETFDLAKAIDIVKTVANAVEGLDAFPRPG